MKKINLLILLVALSNLFVDAQDDCNANAGVAILPSDCIENIGTTLPINEFATAPSGTTTYEFVFTAPVVNDTVERVIGVNATGEFDFSLDTLTMQPFAPGDYGVTVFAYDAEDLLELTTNPAVTIFECIEGDGQESLAEVLTCIQSLGLIMNTLTIDLVIENVLESFAPILLMRPMCYDFSEKQIIKVVDATESCISGINDNHLEAEIRYDPQSNQIAIEEFDLLGIENISLVSINGQRIHSFIPQANLFLPSLQSGIYFLELRSSTKWMSKKVLLR